MAPLKLVNVAILKRRGGADLEVAGIPALVLTAFV
jgi:hypothetical protein